MLLTAETPSTALSTSTTEQLVPRVRRTLSAFQQRWHLPTMCWPSLSGSAFNTYQWCLVWNADPSRVQAKAKCTCAPHRHDAVSGRG